ncbi:MAG: hypothetical protein E6I38_04845 [Chloroflexi bacterium]|nr:MAG: hypothetical protein E6I38_04845 [Chloroflexota bacterium]
MDYRFTDEEESFRTEVRQFLRSELPEDWDFDPFELTEDKWDFARDFTKKLAGKGWVAPAWPHEYGGQGMPYMKQVVLSEEIAYHRAPNTSLIGVTYAGRLPPRPEHQPHRRYLRRPDHHCLRQRRPEEAVPSRHHLRRHRLVPGVLRAQRRFRPRLPPDSSRQGRRRLHHQRHEDLVFQRPQGQLVLLPRPHGH